MGGCCDTSEVGCRNAHSPRPKTLCGVLCCVSAYGPMCVALMLIFGCIVPYYTCFCFDALAKSGHRLLYTYSVFGGLWWFGCLNVSFFRAVFTNPGFVDPVQWRDPPNVVGEGAVCSGNPHYVAQLDSDRMPRFCRRCNCYKPDGSHHCSDCGRCVLRMDHHCPWIVNCVGQNNEKFFFLFIAYVPVCGLHILVTMAYAYSLGVFNNTEATSLACHLVNMIVAMMAGCIALVLAMFALFHLAMLVQAERTVERRIAVLTGKRDLSKEPHWCRQLCCSCRAFGRKSMQRLSIVFGDVRWQWPLPVAPRRYRLRSTTIVLPELPHEMLDLRLDDAADVV